MYRDIMTALMMEHQKVIVALLTWLKHKPQFIKLEVKQGTLFQKNWAIVQRIFKKLPSDVTKASVEYLTKTGVESHLMVFCVIEFLLKPHGRSAEISQQDIELIIASFKALAMKAAIEDRPPD